MNTGITKSKARELALTSRFFVSVLTLFIGLSPQQTLAATSNDQFQQYLFDLCNGNITPPPGVNWDTATLSTMCFNLGGLASGGGGVSANLGTANAGSGISSRKNKGIREKLEEQKEKPERGASADSGGWGFLVAPQYGKGDRPETEQENGYQSELAGVVIGLDYRYSDRFVLGGAIGKTSDRATFLNSAGSLKTSNSTFTLYGTWMPSEISAVDGYLGYGKIDFDSQRYVNIVAGSGGISGTTSGSTSGRQLMAGLSASSQKDFGRVSLSPFINFDYIKTSIDGYDETGTTTLEMHYADRSAISSTSSLGVRMSAPYGHDWGTLLPSARLAAVHEFQNGARQISNELVSAPGSGFLVATDAPDRNYLVAGLGVVAALDSGAQLFIDYEKRTQDKLLSSWAISAGALLEF